MKLIHWLLLATLLKQIIFLAVIPLWHGPDEQAHFAQVQYLAEFGRLLKPTGSDLTTSQEILLSQRFLGTERDGLGKNKFTHRPDYRINYTPTIIGEYEPVINHLPIQLRTQLVKQEATVYPPLFYIASALPYRLAYPLGLISRVFFTRLVSVAMGLTLIWLAYRLGRLIFPRHQLLGLTLPVLVSFQPMFSFLTSTVNSDNLMNLLFTLWLYLTVKIITDQRIQFKYFLSLALTTIAGLFTKPHFVIVFPLLLLLPFFIRPQIKFALRRYPQQVALVFIGLVTIITIYFRPQIIRLSQGQTIGFSEIGLPMLTHPRYNIPLTTHLVWTLRHTIAEVIPWYWGVFNWLGVTLPRVVNRIINRIMILSVLGLLVWLIRLFGRRLDRTAKAKIFLGLSAVTFFVVLFLWDWLFTRGHSFSFGMQGRYYFPLITVHMTFLLVGLTNLVHRSWWIKLIGISVITLNFIGLHTLVKAYYQLWPLSVLFNQVSQYKPLYLKFPYFAVWFTLYLGTLLIFAFKYLNYAHHPRSRA